MNALLLAREEYIKSESCSVLKKALKSRVHTKGEDIVEGDNIYYKKGKEKIWRGPSKVISVNGKKLFIDQGARQATVNRDCAVRVGDEFWTVDALNKNIDSVEIESDEVATEQETGLRGVLTIPCEPLADHAGDTETVTQEEQDTLLQGDQDTQTATTPIDATYTYKDIRKGHKLRFIPDGSEDSLTGKVVLRAGKVGGKHQHAWNIVNDENGEVDNYDTTKFKLLEHIDNENEQSEVEQVFVVMVPRYLHNDRPCIDAKEKELANWDEFNVYEEVPDVGQEYIGTSWMLVEKVTDGKLSVKARLCLRGDQEKGEFRTDSPTIHKSAVNVFFMLAAKNRWEIQTSDVKCAFLQGELIDREVFVKPPECQRKEG